MLELARRAWGNPTGRKGRESVRFGSNGSKVVDLNKLSWFDFEANEGGGFDDLHENVTAQRPETETGIAATYDYVDERGGLIFQVVRMIPNKFVQRRPDGAGGWIWSTKGIRRVLYRLPELIAAPPDSLVFICEGEKDVDNLRALGRQMAARPDGGSFA